MADNSTKDMDESSYVPLFNELYEVLQLSAVRAEPSWKIAQRVMTALVKHENLVYHYLNDEGDRAALYAGDKDV